MSKALAKKIKELQSAIAELQSQLQSQSKDSSNGLSKVGRDIYDFFVKKYGDDMPISRDALKENIKEWMDASSFKELCRLDSDAILNVGITPFYLGFFNGGEDRGEVEKIVQRNMSAINMCGLFTTDSQDGTEDQRAYINGITLNNEKAKKWCDLLNREDGIIAFCSSKREFGAMKYFTVTYDGGESYSSMNLMDGFLDDMINANLLNKGMIEELKSDKYIVINIIDTVYNRNILTGVVAKVVLENRQF